jgi:hypothetical protein
VDVHSNGLNQDPFPLMIVPMEQVTDGTTALNARIGPIVWLVVARVRSMDDVVLRHHLESHSDESPNR